ncbi:MAG: RES family NAD+ phosphorylase [Gammaproteobacteria bacterium]|nr:RES family NAD+ phosphorylase [Gammaproteobacteria bacterium]MCP5136443.1 RES family NAD+ phosphorylase [Gammaproteobacteria bacterium]
MRVWRICSSRHATSAFSGIGSKQVGGRWTPPGRLAVYTAEQQSTAILEMLVHMDPRHFSTGFVVIAADLPDNAALETVDTEALPGDWRTRTEDPRLRRIGRDWLERGDTLALRVPSVVSPPEFNLILNPAHPDFERITIHAPEPFLFDPRLRR